MIEQFTSYFTKLEQLSSDELLRSAEKLVVTKRLQDAALDLCESLVEARALPRGRLRLEKLQHADAWPLEAAPLSETGLWLEVVERRTI